MKKLVVTVLSVIMCMSLVACGSNKYEEYAKYEELFELLEDEEYEEAQEYVAELAEKDNKLKDKWFGKEEEETVSSEVPASSEAPASSEVPASSEGPESSEAPASSEAPSEESLASDEEETNRVTIATAEEFFAIEEFRNGTIYEIVADLDFAGYERYGGWVSGIVEGNGHTIYNVEYGGVFETNTGTIRNLVIECDIDITNTSHEGRLTMGVLSISNNGLIENCVVKGSVNLNARTINFGAITETSFGTLRRCGNEADIHVEGTYINPLGKQENIGSVSVGGVCQYTVGPVEECYNTGTISADNVTSGYLAGVVADTNGTLSNCYNAGAVMQGENIHYTVGGITHRVWGSNQLIQCCNFGPVEVGISGEWYGYVVDCYYLASASSEGAIDGEYMTEEAEQNSDKIRVHKLTDDMIDQQESYEALDFDEVWTMSDKGHPILQWQENFY